MTIFRKNKPQPPLAFHQMWGEKKQKKNQQKSPNNEISSTELQSTLQVNWN